MLQKLNLVLNVGQFQANKTRIKPLLLYILILNNKSILFLSKTSHLILSRKNADFDSLSSANTYTGTCACHMQPTNFHFMSNQN